MRFFQDFYFQHDKFCFCRISLIKFDTWGNFSFVDRYGDKLFAPGNQFGFKKK